MIGEKLHNWDFINRCYDVLAVDPMKIDNKAAFKMAFNIGEDNFEPIRSDGEPLQLHPQPHVHEDSRGDRVNEQGRDVHPADR
jgi:hypothetical protein